MFDKKIVHKELVKHLEEKRKALIQEIQKLEESAFNETKSSVGDKYETARAMAHQEEDKLALQLAEYEKQLGILSSINPEQQLDSIGAGALIECSNGWFYISVSAGKLVVEDKQVFVLSPLAPLVQSLMGLKKDTQIQFRGKQIIVKQVF